MHGGDLVAIGKGEDLAWSERGLEKHYGIKTGLLGPSGTDKEQVKVLNRVISWTDTGIDHEADPRHVELILNTLLLTDAKRGLQPRHQRRWHDETRDR